MNGSKIVITEDARERRREEKEILFVLALVCARRLVTRAPRVKCCDSTRK